MQHVCLRLSLGAAVAFVAILLIFSMAIADEKKKGEGGGVWVVQIVGLTRSGEFAQKSEYKGTEKECRLMVALLSMSVAKMGNIFSVAGVDCRWFPMERVKPAG